jgi:hypothetical protein
LTRSRARRRSSRRDARAARCAAVSIRANLNDGEAGARQRCEGGRLRRRVGWRRAHDGDRGPIREPACEDGWRSPARRARAGSHRRPRRPPQAARRSVGDRPPRSLRGGASSAQLPAPVATPDRLRSPPTGAEPAPSVDRQPEPGCFPRQIPARDATRTARRSEGSIPPTRPRANVRRIARVPETAARP